MRRPPGGGAHDGPDGSGDMALGIDVGGTKVLGVVLDRWGRVLAEKKLELALSWKGSATTASSNDIGGPVGESRATGSAGGREVIGDSREGSGADAVLHLIRILSLELSTEVAGDPGAAVIPRIGLGIPGAMDEAGIPQFSANLRALQGIDASQRLMEQLGEESGMHDAGDCLRVVVENDANCALVGEAVLGAAKGFDDVLLVTLGTGIGGALVVGGRLVHGAHGYAGEVGHVPVEPGGIQCPCGRRGCFERYVSGTASVYISVDEMPGYLARALAAVILVVDPAVVVVGGGFGAAMGERLLSPSRRLLPGLLPEYGGGQVPELVPAELGERAGAIGAALLALALEPAAG